MVPGHAACQLMPTTKDVQGECQHCGGLLRFPAEHLGMESECPHCGRATELILAAPPEEASPVRTKAIIFTVVAVIILGGGVVGSTIALKRAKKMAGNKSPAAAPATPATPAAPANPFEPDGFRASSVTLEKTTGTKLTHAHGSVVNILDRQRFGVKVELELFDAAGKSVGKSSDYTGVIETNATWNFRAPVLEGKAASAKVASVKETK